MNIQNKFAVSWKKVQESITDAATISTREIKRGMNEAKKQFGKVKLIQRRKELFAELGRNLYEAQQDGLPTEINSFLKESELYEIILEIKETDEELIKLRGQEKE